MKASRGATHGGGANTAAQSLDHEERKGAEEALPFVSVVVAVAERPAPLDDLYRAYASALRDAGYAFEFVFACEPYLAEAADPIRDLAGQGEPVSVVDVGQARGEAALLNEAMGRCRGEVLVTLPGYFRVDVDVVPRLIEAVEDGVDLAVARRSPRHDSWINRVQSRIFHRLLGAAAGERIDDIACGVRAMRPEVIEEVPLYGDFFRFFPLFVRREGFQVSQLDAPQHAGDRETRVYRPGVYLRRLIDLLGVFFLVRFTYKPLRFFGLVGVALGLAGAVILLVLLVQRLGGQGIADRPLLLLGVLLVTIGIQSFALGLVGEIIVHLHAPGRSTYRVLGESARED